MYPDSSQQLTYETEDGIYFFCDAFDPLDNWSPHAVKIWNTVFPSVEHAYHYRKFSDTAPDLAKEILAAPSPWKTMQIAHAHTDKMRPDWQEVKVSLMTEIVRAKVAQNEDVRDCLLKTGSKVIYENSPWDKFWGRGSDGTGQNNLGKILMQIRDELLQSEKAFRA